LSVAAVVAAIVAIEVSFVATLLGVGLGRELEGHVSCTNGWTVARTAQGKIACLSPASQLPPNWLRISSSL
jgi:hypothetical protein